MNIVQSANPISRFRPDDVTLLVKNIDICVSHRCTVPQPAGPRPPPLTPRYNEGNRRGRATLLRLER